MRFHSGNWRSAVRILSGECKQQQQQQFHRQRRCFSSRISPPGLISSPSGIHRPETGLVTPPRLLFPGPQHLQQQQQRRGFLGFGDGDEDRGLSKQHEEKRVMGYSPEQLFDVVAAVDMYQDFVPWCTRSTVLWKKEHELEAELEIGFKFFVESYISHVQLDRPKLVKTTVSKSTIFEYLNNIWQISPGPSPGTCNLHFKVDFQFRSPLYTKVANVFFDEVVGRLVGAFEERCYVVYGPSKVSLHA